MKDLNYVDLFMHIYMCELETQLKTHSDELIKISFKLDEANTDRPLKEYLKNIIETRYNRINALARTKLIEFTDCSYPIDENILNIYIQKVLLPDEITDDIKNLLKSRKDAVFTNPDLCLELNVNGLIEYETIELKSTKSDSIPGSSVQQVSPFEWVIFIKHNKDSIEIVTGQYVNSINTKMQFPDRSPRPQVSFSELQKWNKAYRLIKDYTIQFNSSDDNKKAMLLNDWQDVLAERWTNIVYSDKKRKREPWFNNNLRKFIIKFLCRYDKMTPEEKEKYKQMLNNLIK